MSEFFLKIVNMSISASWVVLAVLVLRLLLKKAPKWVNVLLWGIVAVRLVCPFSLESALSLIPSAETVSPQIMMDRTPHIDSGVPVINQVVNPIISHSFAPQPMASANPLQILIPVAANFWVLGILILLVYTFISYWRIRRKVRTAVLLKENIFQSENVVSPFVLGIMKPKIYLSFHMNSQDMAHVVAHEQAHICRKDHWWKPIGFLILAVYWFNPLLWLGYVLLCRDIELACDEKVVKEFDTAQKADYSQALLSCSVNRRMIAACPLAFGEVGVKNRVKSVLNYKKPAFWLIVVAVVVSVVVAVCFLTNPKSTGSKDTSDKVMDKLLKLEEYEIIEQDRKTVRLSIPKASLPEDIFTEEGRKFEENQIPAYQDETTTIYLREARYSNEGQDNLYFCFNFAFNLPKEHGVIIYPYEILDNGIKSSSRTADGILRAGNGEFDDAVNDRGSGPGNLLWFYVSADALRQAQGNISFDIIANQISYWLDADDYVSISDMGGADGPENVVITPAAVKLPDLSVAGPAGTVEAGKGTSSWTYQMKNGEFATMNYDSSHPLALKDTMPVLEVLPNYFSHTDPNIVTLWFISSGNEIPPDKLSVLCWGEEASEKSPAGGENVETIRENGKLAIKLKDGNYIYEVTAVWSSASQYSGTVRYHFRTEALDLSELSYPEDWTVVDVTPAEQMEEKIKNEEFVYTKPHYKAYDLWRAGGYTYKYRLEITGRMHNAAKNTTYIVLSNTENITFDMAWKAAGYSSNSEDYFDPQVAMIVGSRLFE